MAKSNAGKSRSRLNALKHGLCATDELFLAHLTRHEREVFENLRGNLHADYRPQTEPEKLLVDHIAIQHFRLFRLYDLEHIATRRCRHDPLARESILPHLDRLSRYDWRIERQLRVLHNRLKSLYQRRLDYSLNTFPTHE